MGGSIGLYVHVPRRFPAVDSIVESPLNCAEVNSWPITARNHASPTITAECSSPVVVPPLASKTQDSQRSHPRVRSARAWKSRLSVREIVVPTVLAEAIGRAPSGGRLVDQPQLIVLNAEEHADTSTLNFVLQFR
jgi:hypothetical protein